MQMLSYSYIIILYRLWFYSIVITQLKYKTICAIINQHSKVSFHAARGKMTMCCEV